MKTPIRLIIGLLSILPLIFWVNKFAYLLGFYLPISPAFSDGLIAIGIVLFFYFIYKLIKVETIGTKSKILWIARFILTGFIAMPIFWYFFILQEEEYAKFGEEDSEEELANEIEEDEKSI